MKRFDLKSLWNMELRPIILNTSIDRTGRRASVHESRVTVDSLVRFRCAVRTGYQDVDGGMTPWYVALIEREIFSPSHPDYPAGFGTSFLPTPEVSVWPACPDGPRAVPAAPSRSPSPRARSTPGSSGSGPSTSA